MLKIKIINSNMRNSENLKKDSFDVVKIVLIALLFTLAAVLIFALIIKWASLSDAVILPVNYIIKICALLLGCILGIKHTQNGIIKGAIGGLLYVLFSFLIFAALDGFKSSSFNWIDLICLTVAGGIGGIITVNVKSRKNA